MRDRAIYVVAVGEAMRAIASIGADLLRDFADRVGADLIVCQRHPEPIYGRCDVYDLLSWYDRVLYFDADTIIRTDTPNIFDLVTEEKLGVCITSKNTLFHCQDIKALQRLNAEIGWSEDYFNSGMFLASTAHRDLFRLRGDFKWNRFPDQDLLNYRVQQQQVKLHDLGYRFNHTSVPPGQENMTSYVTHFCGIPMSQRAKVMLACRSKINSVIDLEHNTDR